MLFIRHLIKPLHNLLLFLFQFIMNCWPFALVYIFKTSQLTEELISTQCSVSSMFIPKHSSVISSHNSGELINSEKTSYNYLSLSKF